MDCLGKKINVKYEIDGRVAMQCDAMRCVTSRPSSIDIYNFLLLFTFFFFPFPLSIIIYYLLF